MAARYFEGTAHAALYAKFRPVAPSQLIVNVINFLKEKYDGVLHSAADVGCGSGQSTKALSSHFSYITGIDVSNSQIEEAKNKIHEKNINFRVSPAEKLDFKSSSLQLVTAGQACHWFDLPKFYEEVDRVLVPNGVLAMYCYTFPRPIWKEKSDELFDLMMTIYSKDTKGLWGEERVDVDDMYKDKKFVIPYPDRLRMEGIMYDQPTSVTDLVGYISTWSGFQKYQSVHGDEAAAKLLKDFRENIMGVIGSSESPEELPLHSGPATTRKAVNDSPETETQFGGYTHLGGQGEYVLLCMNGAGFTATIHGGCSTSRQRMFQPYINVVVKILF